MFRRQLPATKPNKTQKLNEKISRIVRSTTVEDIRKIPDFDDILSNNPQRDKVLGYYVQMPLSEYETFVPNSQQFPDRYGQHYSGGQFDSPLFTLEEWQNHWNSVHANVSAPDLLVNANWFNVWNTGVPNKGEKINPRTQARTYLIGLSLSNGDLVSSHHVLDQGNVGLDTLVIDTLEDVAELIEHHNIDSKEPAFYKNKNAVSGFIIMKDNQNVKTPDLNNNHNNRLPRTGVGYHHDGKNIVVMVVHNPDRSIGVTAEEFANLFRALNCNNAINLDNSGSAELYYKGLGEYGVQNVTVKTQTCDFGAGSERPKPNFIGFKNSAKHQFFASDDSDLPSKNAPATPTGPQTKADDIVTYSCYRRN